MRAERRKYSRTELTMISMIQAFQDNKAGMRGREGVSNACIIAFHERFGGPWLSLPVISSQNMQVKIKNISLGGAFILCKKPLPSHEYFNLVFTTHNNKTFLLNAKAVWSNIGTNRKKSIPSGSGIRFLKISEDDKRRLGEVIEGEIVS
ncbi:MAG: PilZ domain-containing protein [bacterium]